MVIKIIQCLIRAAGANLPLFWFYELSLTRKESKAARGFFWFAAVAYTLCVFFVTYTNSSSSMLSVASFLFPIFTLIFCYTDKPLYKMMIFFCYMLIVVVGLDMIVTLFYRIIFQDTVDYVNDFSVRNSVTLSIYSVLEIALFYWMSKIIQYTRQKKLRADKTIFLFMLIPVGQWCFVVTFMRMWAFDAAAFNEFVNKPLFFSGCVITLVSDILLLKALIDNCIANAERFRLAELEYENKLTLSYYENINKNAEQLMKFKHDLNNNLGTAYSLISSDDEQSKKQGVEMLSELLQKNSRSQLPYYCSNRIVNALLTEKAETAAEKGAELEINVTLPEGLNVQATDLCSIFTNMIDNGLNSAAVSQCKKVEISAKYEMGMIFVNCKNYPDELPELNQKNKKNDITQGKLSQHGYGLSILSDIVKRYDGSVKIDTSDGNVEVLCAIKSGVEI